VSAKAPGPQGDFPSTYREFVRFFPDDEVCSRYPQSRGLLFRRLLEQSVVSGPVTEDDVTGGYDW
jgi:hypothetical protein